MANQPGQFTFWTCANPNVRRLRISHQSYIRVLMQVTESYEEFRAGSVNTNRWDPILNYPGSMGVALRLRLYLNEYLSDLHVFCIRF